MVAILVANDAETLVQWHCLQTIPWVTPYYDTPEMWRCPCWKVTWGNWFILCNWGIMWDSSINLYDWLVTVELKKKGFNLNSRENPIHMVTWVVLNCALHRKMGPDSYSCFDQLQVSSAGLGHIFRLQRNSLFKIHAAVSGCEMNRYFSINPRTHGIIALTIYWSKQLYESCPIFRWRAQFNT